jgi:hypothetical protein
MDTLNSQPENNERSAMLYGIQRSGSNYTQQLLLRNFRNIRFYNRDISRCLPTHKHFRLYNEKAVIPSARYLNAFTYNNFAEFKQHVEQILEKEINAFLVCIKDPYSWYLSYKKHARKNKNTYFKRSPNSHYLIDYSLFYRKWLDFSMEAPAEVVILRYEDLIEDLEDSIKVIGEKFNLERSSHAVVNPTKVAMSKEFTQSRSSFYTEKKYLNLISKQEKSVIKHLLDPVLMSKLNYHIV